LHPNRLCATQIKDTAGHVPTNAITSSEFRYNHPHQRFII
jgi:hypothetical protein